MSCCLAAWACPKPCCKRPACNKARSLAAPVPNSASCTPARPLPSAPKAACWSRIPCCCICVLRSNSESVASITCDWYGDIKSCTPCWKAVAPKPTPPNAVPAAVPAVCACCKKGAKEPTPWVAKFCACVCNASWPATCGASPAKLCFLTSKAWAASCLALNASADSPPNCDILPKPPVTIGTPCWANTFSARLVPSFSTKGAGLDTCSVTAIILLPLIFVMFETFL